MFNLENANGHNETFHSKLYLATYKIGDVCCTYHFSLVILWKYVVDLYICLVF